MRELSVLAVMGASLLTVLQEEASSRARGARPLLLDPAKQPEFDITKATECCRSWGSVCKRTIQL